MKLLFVILTLCIILILIHNNNIITLSTFTPVFNFEKDFNKTFINMLRIRRKIERLNNINNNEILNSENFEELKFKYKDFFYVIIDSGNLGNKYNSEVFANKLGIPTIKKFYIGKLNKLNNITDDINNFIIKPLNLSRSTGLMIIKNKKDIIKNKQFANNSEIISYYIKNNKKLLNSNIIVQDNIKAKVRPTEIKVYSFNGTSPIILLMKWNENDKRTTSFFDKQWNILYGVDHKRPRYLSDIIYYSNKITKELGTFMRIDFLIEDGSEQYYFCETSSYPVCASDKMWPTNEINKSLYKYWLNCFPFNKNNLENIYNESVQWTKKEDCR